MFVSFFAIGAWKFKTVILSLSDFGQILVMTSENSHTDKIVSLLKNCKNCCYLTLNKSCKEIADLFLIYNINESAIQIIDASEKQTNPKNCITIRNNPDEIKTFIKRILIEKDFRCIILDDISSIQNIKDFELPKFIQDISAIIKSTNTQGFFIGKKEDLDNKIINDITMIVDKVEG
jgi:hypothetical protein